jgi:predicted oxidoreductase
MNQLSGDHLLNYEKIRSQIEARDRELDNKFSKDTGELYQKYQKLFRRQIGKSGCSP